MKEYVILVAIGIFSYLIGCISPSISLAKMAGIDIKSEGSGNAGTTNTLRVLGGKAALIVLVVDIFKGFLAVRIGYGFGNDLGALVAFTCVIIGHVFPAFYKFKGGKGVATSFGAAIALNWPSAFALLLIAAIILFVSRRMSVASIIAAISYPFLIWYYLENDKMMIYYSVAIALFILFTHRSNIKRLIKHEEPELDILSKLGISLKDEKDETEQATDKIVEDAAQYEEPEPMDYYEGVKIPKLKKDEKLNISVIGNGSFGTSMANLLVHNGHQVMIYGRNKETIDSIKETRINEKYLPFVLLSEKLKYTHVLKTAVSNRDIVVFAVPAQSFRGIAKRAAKYLKKDAVVVNLAKGIEQKSLALMSEVAKETMPDARYVALSGPSHAEEIVRNYPAALVAASTDESAAKLVQNTFMNEKLRVYTSDDLVGVEVGGAVKNVIAIATGISDGMRFGNNTRAALMTRATHEISKLGVALNANPKTFAGLSGIGDLMVTCTTNLSRNRRCGLFIGLGLTPEQAVEKVGTTVEGFYTAQSTKELADKLGIEMPITQATYSILTGEITPEEALKSLMSRDKKEETE